MWNDFPGFLTCIFNIFAFITPGKQPCFEISDDHPSNTEQGTVTHARDHWWTLDFAKGPVIIYGRAEGNFFFPKFLKLKAHSWKSFFN